MLAPRRVLRARIGEARPGRPGITPVTRFGEARATQSRNDLRSSMWSARFTAVLLGARIVAAQLVPWWLSRQAYGKPQPVAGDESAG